MIMNSSGNASFFGEGEQVMFESQTELIATWLCLLLSLLVAVVSQLLVIVSIVRTPSLHEPHFYILLACCVADLATVTIAALGIIIFSIHGHQEWMCNGTFGDGVAALALSVHLGSSLHVAVIAYERFVYFVQPFKYLQSFTSWRIAGYMIAPYLVSIAWTVITNLTHGRDFHAGTLGCYLPFTPWLYGLEIFLFLVPPSIASIGTIVRVLRFTRTISPQGGSASSSASAAVSASATPVHQIRRAVRMMLLLSGAFWLSVVPGHVALITIFSSGITWADIDSRRCLSGLIIIRLRIWLLTCLQPILNPIIYIYSRKDLRHAMRKMFWRTNQASPDANELQ